MTNEERIVVLKESIKELSDAVVALCRIMQSKYSDWNMGGVDINYTKKALSKALNAYESVEKIDVLKLK